MGRNDAKFKVHKGDGRIESCRVQSDRVTMGGVSPIGNGLDPRRILVLGYGNSVGRDQAVGWE